MDHLRPGRANCWQRSTLWSPPMVSSIWQTHSEAIKPPGIEHNPVQWGNLRYLQKRKKVRKTRLAPPNQNMTNATRGPLRDVNRSSLSRFDRGTLRSFLLTDRKMKSLSSSRELCSFGWEYIHIWYTLVRVFFFYWYFIVEYVEANEQKL